VLEVLKENKTSTGTTKYSTNIVKPAVVRLPEPTCTKRPVLGVLARVLEYSSIKTKAHARIGLEQPGARYVKRRREVTSQRILVSPDQHPIKVNHNIS
jgi:hypothetical protein